jgi:hypothetical protein
LAAPAARRRLWLQVWFSGLRIDGAGRGLVVVYPSVAASSDGQRLVLHAKVATFRCAARVADGSPNYAGCQRRSVEYGDLTGPAVQVRRPAGHLVLAGRFPTYTYRRGVDRDRRVRPRWTGRTYQIRLDVRPDQPAPGPPGTATVAGVVTLGSGRTAVSAAVDAGYPNRIQLADPAPAPPAAGPPTGRVVPP